MPSSAASATPSDAGCRTDYSPVPLPTWARAGFTPPDQPVPYVLSDRGDVVAILWADHDPLVAPPVAGRNNKILWVPRVASPVGTPLQIRATLTSTGMTATRAVDGGLGPSTIDLPAPGCWSVLPSPGATTTTTSTSPTPRAERPHSPSPRRRCGEPRRPSLGCPHR